MSRRRGPRLSVSQKKELWERWKRAPTIHSFAAASGVHVAQSPATKAVEKAHLTVGVCEPDREALGGAKLQPQLGESATVRADERSPTATSPLHSPLVHLVGTCCGHAHEADIGMVRGERCRIRTHLRARPSPNRTGPLIHRDSCRRRKWGRSGDEWGRAFESRPGHHLFSRGWRVAPLSADPQLSRTTPNHSIASQAFAGCRSRCECGGVVVLKLLSRDADRAGCPCLFLFGRQ
jgi:hypothetical protein